ncbi:MAG: HAD hydrolase-like protein [Oscillospiraceae bacterium]
MGAFQLTRLAIFDLDGTLVDSLEDLADACNAALIKAQQPTHEADAYRLFVGNGREKLIERMLPEACRSEALARTVLADYNAFYTVHLTDKTKPYAGITRTLAALKDAGILCAVNTNKPQFFADVIIEALFAPGTFAAVFGKNERFPEKPDPSAVLALMARFDADAAHTVFAGDSGVDAATARHAGIPCVGCAWGFRGRDELEAAGADAVADTPDRLAALIIERLPGTTANFK